MPVFVGIDPGVGGALGAVDEAGNLLDALDMPVMKVGTKSRVVGSLVRDFLRGIDNRTVGDRARVVVEQVGPMPHDGAAGSFSFGHAAGIVEGVAYGMGLHVTMVTPANWKRQMGLSSDKEHSRSMALRQWPDQSALFARKKDDGRAEAALMALWLQRQRALVSV